MNRVPCLALLLSIGAVVVAAQCPIADPSVCRMVVTAQNVASLTPDSMDQSSPDHIQMHYDLTLDPNENGTTIPWILGVDAAGMTAYEYTLPTGCLGPNGPLGYMGPLGSQGALPNRVHGKTRASRTRSWANGWCASHDDDTEDDLAKNSSCVYGPGGPLGESGPLNPSAYYNTLYHLQEGVAWWQDYNVNLDGAGVWAIQGPLGPTGAMGVLGALGPLGISPQAGITTLTSGVYEAEGYGVVRTTAPLLYAADGSAWRAYDLYEMYTKKYAQSMPDNDCSFAVDSYESNPADDGDAFLFHSNHSQFVSVLVTPVNLLDSFGITVLNLNVTSGNWTAVAGSYSDSTAGGLINWASFRALPGETFSVVVQNRTTNAPVESGYYLYVTGSGLYQGDSADNLTTTDVWGPRPQSSGPDTFNVVGAHQNWISFFS